MTTFPTLAVEIDVTTADVLASPATFTWTPISSRVRNDAPLTIERGQNTELGRIEPGRCTLVLNNRDRAFDPLYTSSPYNGFVTPMRPFRVSATYSSTTYRLFTGFTERFTPEWGEGGSRDHTVQLEAVDALDYLARSPLGLEPLLTWITEESADVLVTFYDITGGRRLHVRLVDAPTDTVIVSTRGTVYGSGSFVTEQLTFTADNYLTGVTGSLAYTSLTRLECEGPGSAAGIIVEVGMMPSFPAEQSDVHIGWALDLAGWPTAARSLQTGITTCTAWEARVAGDGYQVSDIADGDTILSGLQRITESESGILFVNGAGTLVFQNRYHRSLNRTSTATLGSGAGEVPVIFDRPPALDSAEIRNIVRITPHAGGAQVASDAASIARYGRRSWAKGGLLISAGEALDLANYKLLRGATPRPRTPRATIVGDDARWVTMLGAEIGNAYTLRQRPPNVGGSVDNLVFLEAITWEIQRGSWRARWGFSEDPGTFWVLGDATYGQLGTTTIAGY